MKGFMLKIVFVLTLILGCTHLLVACEDTNDDFDTDDQTDVMTEENKTEEVETPTEETENGDSGDTKTEEVETNPTPIPQFLYLTTSGQIDELDGVLTSKTGEETKSNTDVLFLAMKMLTALL